MADHLDSPGLTSPGMDARIDITDHFAFQKPGDPSKSILIMNVNPLARASAFNPDAIYEILIDTDADALPNVAFKINFADVNGGQLATVRRAADSLALGRDLAGDIIFQDAPASFSSTPTISQSGDFKFFAGLRSDPFFFDLLAFLNGLKFTTPGTDFFTVFMHGKEKTMFNRAQPNTDVARFTDDIVAVLEQFGYSSSQAGSLAAVLLPDILTYNFSSSSGFLNGRRLTDDVIDIELGLVTNGAITTDGVGAHTDYLSDFPYLGPPH